MDLHVLISETLLIVRQNACTCQTQIRGRSFKTTKKYVLMLIQISKYDDLRLSYTLNRLDASAMESTLLSNP